MKNSFMWKKGETLEEGEREREREAESEGVCS